METMVIATSLPSVCMVGLMSGLHIDDPLSSKEMNKKIPPVACDLKNPVMGGFLFFLIKRGGWDYSNRGFLKNAHRRFLCLLGGSVFHQLAESMVK